MRYRYCDSPKDGDLVRSSPAGQSLPGGLQCGNDVSVRFTVNEICKNVYILKMTIF